MRKDTLTLDEFREYAKVQVATCYGMNRKKAADAWKVDAAYLSKFLKGNPDVQPPKRMLAALGFRKHVRYERCES